MNFIFPQATETQKIGLLNKSHMTLREVIRHFFYLLAGFFTVHGSRDKAIGKYESIILCFVPFLNRGVVWASKKFISQLSNHSS